MELRNLVGSHILSGIEVGTEKTKRYFREEPCNYIKFTLDGVTYLAREDPDDGYRSYMEELEIVEGTCKIKLPDVSVFCHMRGDTEYEVNDVLVFTDAMNCKEILAIGTENTNDYYPYCVLEYTPENMSCNADKK